MLGLEELPWLHTDRVLTRLPSGFPTCRKRDVTFVQDGITEGYRKKFHQGGNDSRILADNTYLCKVLGKEFSPGSSVALHDIVAHVAGDMSVDQKSLQNSVRNRDATKACAIIGYLARKLDAAPLTDVATYFQRDVSTLSRQRGEIENQATSLPEIKCRMGKYINTMAQAWPQ